MPVFEYTARNLKGDLEKGQVDLPSRDDVIAHLRRNRLVVVQVRQAPAQLSLGGMFKPGVKTRDVVIFTRQFATMINAGLPLVQALDILAQQTDNKVLGDITRQVVYDVESGQTLADALRKHPKAFTDLYVNMVAAGEAGGILDTILQRLAEFLEKNDAIVRKVKGAMVYPAVIMSVAVIAVAVLLIFVIPTFQNMFASVNPAALLVGDHRGHRSHGVRHQSLLQDRRRTAADRCVVVTLPGARRRPAQVGGLALHAHAGDADLLGGFDPGRAGDHRAHGGGHGDPQCRDGIAAIDRGR